MKFTPRSESTRNHIIETSAEVFNKKGYSGTSITDLEKATGLTKGSIYGNFQNKDAIALAAFDYNLSNKRAMIKERVDQCTTYKEKLITSVMIYHTSSKAFFIPGGCPMQNTAVESDDTNDELRKRAAKGLIAWMENLTEIIEKGIAAQEFKADTEAKETALHLISIIEGAVLISRATQDRKYANILLDTGVKVVEGISL